MTYPMARRRRRRRRRRNYAILRNPSASNTPIAKSLITTLKYATAIRMTQTVADTMKSHYFRANSIYDPDFTGGGHQPLGTDQLLALYEHFTVLGSKITLRCINADSTNNAILAVSTVSETSTAVLDINRLIELGKSKYAVLTDNAGGKPQTTVSQYFNTKRFFGVKDPNGDDQYQGSASSNPAEEAFFLIGMQNLAPAVVVNSVDCMLEIEYRVQFSEPKIIAQS